MSASSSSTHAPSPTAQENRIMEVLRELGKEKDMWKSVHDGYYISTLKKKERGEVEKTVEDAFCDYYEK